MAELWKGAPAAQSLTEALELRTARLRENGITPTLAIVRLGERPEDLAYERGAYFSFHCLRQEVPAVCSACRLCLARR